jgi:hypothetical protein
MKILCIYVVENKPHRYIGYKRLSEQLHVMVLSLIELNKILLSYLSLILQTDFFVKTV